MDGSSNRVRAVVVGLIAATMTSSAWAAKAINVKVKAAVFDPVSGVLTVTAKKQSTQIVVSRDSAGTLFVNGGSELITGGVPTVINTTRIDLFGGAGDDVLQLDESNGVLPPAMLYGEGGNDALTGGSGSDQLSGGAGNDSVEGKRGNDVLAGDAGDDVFTWNPGEGSDSIEGGDGSDQLRFNGSNVSEVINLVANGNRLTLFRDIGAVTIDSGNVEQVSLRTIGGADNVQVNDLSSTAATLVAVDFSVSGSPGVGDGAIDNLTVNGTDAADTVTVTGNAGLVSIAGLHAEVTVAGSESTDQVAVNSGLENDSISAAGLGAGLATLILVGSAGNDQLTGSGGDDSIFGGPGNDTITAGNGNDVIVWSPGDGSDVVNGQGGSGDRLQFNGANIAEQIGLVASGAVVRVTRNVGNITVDVSNVEVVDLLVRGGADVIDVGEMTGTSLTQGNVSLESAPGSSVGDGSSDTVVLHGTNGDDSVSLAGASGVANISGLAQTWSINGAEAANDNLIIRGDGGDDVIAASALTAEVLQLTEDGGDGADILIGSAGNDTLLGGDGDDVLMGGPGIDVLDGGPGNNILIQD
jgi:Ca2+-binding RTX toxin-like protein